jgi:hypothetical protein
MQLLAGLPDFVLKSLGERGHLLARALSLLLQLLLVGHLHKRCADPEVNVHAVLCTCRIRLSLPPRHRISSMSL